MMSKAVTWGEYFFFLLTSEQKHLAIEHRAEAIYKNRISEAKWRDWEQAVASVATRDNPYPKDKQVKPIAQQNYETRAAKITEEMRQRLADDDWLNAEKELTLGFRGAYLPVDKVPQLKPSFQVGVIG
jgi:hypothetical protein